MFNLSTLFFRIISVGLAPVVPPERQMRAIMEVDQVEEQVII